MNNFNHTILGYTKKKFTILSNIYIDVNFVNFKMFSCYGETSYSIPSNQILLPAYIYGCLQSGKGTCSLDT